MNGANLEIKNTKIKTFRDAFTLIELLVVISIISLLASVLLLGLNNARIKARDSKRKDDIQALRTALDVYYHNGNNAYPNGGTAGSPNTEVDIQQLSSFLVPTYVSKIPNDPSSGPGNYEYVWKNNGADYGLLVPFGNDGGVSCKWRTAGGSNNWWKVGAITMPDCSY